MRRLYLINFLFVLLLMGVVYAGVDLNQALTGSLDLSTNTFTEDTDTNSYGGVTIDMIRQEIKLLDPVTTDTIVPAVDLSLVVSTDTAFRVISSPDGLVKVGDPDVLMTDADFGILRGGTIMLDNIIIKGNRSIIADENATVALYAIEEVPQELSANIILEDSATSPKVYKISLEAGKKILVQLQGAPHDAYIFFPGHPQTQAAIDAASSNKWQVVYSYWKQGDGKKIWYPSNAVLFTAPSDGQYTIIVVKFTGNNNQFTIAVKEVNPSGGSGGNNNQGSGGNNNQNQGGNQGSNESTYGFQDFFSNYGIYIAAGVGILFLLMLVMGGLGGPRRGSMQLKTTLVLLLSMGGVALAILAFINSTYLTYVAYGLGAIGIFVLVLFFMARKGHRLF